MVIFLLRPVADQRRPLADQRRPLADQRRPLAATKVMSDQSRLEAGAKEAFPKDPVSQNRKCFAVVRYRSLRQRSLFLFIRIASNSRYLTTHLRKQIDRVLRKSPPSPLLIPPLLRNARSSLRLRFQTVLRACLCFLEHRLNSFKRPVNLLLFDN